MPSTTVFHVDVFATCPLSGNGLTVFLDSDGWSPSEMQLLTREMRQFESIFLSNVGPTGATARVFTVEEELPFAGHPVLGAAAVLHRTQSPQAGSRSWVLRLPHGDVSVETKSRGDHYACEMNQGAPIFGGDVSSVALSPILARLGLTHTDVVEGITAQVISTGLQYLIIPVYPAALSRAAINTPDFEERLGGVGAKFVLVLDVDGREMRTWDNLGQVEDVATGSAAGPAAAFLFHFGLADPTLPIALAQGRFAGRPSKIAVARDKEGNLLVSGDVWPVSHGILDMNPSGPRFSS
jgi:trans-2,3-dihydro-3-hydroxyanthranilate isomerase